MREQQLPHSTFGMDTFAHSPAPSQFKLMRVVGHHPTRDPRDLQYNQFMVQVHDSMQAKVVLDFMRGRFGAPLNPTTYLSPNNKESLAYWQASATTKYRAFTWIWTDQENFDSGVPYQSHIEIEIFASDPVSIQMALIWDDYFSHLYLE